MHYKFINPHKHMVQLVGPDKKVIKIDGGEEKTLPGFFMRYCPKFLRIKDPSPQPTPVPRSIQAQLKHTQMPSTSQPSQRPPIVVHRLPTKLKRIKTYGGIQRISLIRKSTQQSKAKQAKATKLVGHTIGVNAAATSHLHNAIKDITFTISNNIGVGILSYNRLDSIKRLLESIESHTNLSRTTIFVSDESNYEDVKQYLRTKKWMVLLDNNVRLGVAGNSNRLLRCLDRFKYKLILNDDVEVLAPGWDKFYADAMYKTNIHHFCYRQIGIYGARQSDHVTELHNGFNINTIMSRPHGAVMAFDDSAFNAVGYFDTEFGLYGMEHVDWSNRVSLSGIQKSGFHDIEGSDKFFAIHNDPTSINNKSEELSKSKQLYAKHQNDKNRIFIKSEIAVPSISYIIPYRSGQERGLEIDEIVSNIRAQQFPHINIIVVEQDSRSTMGNSAHPITYCHLSNNEEFCKSAAFNYGVSQSKDAFIILHDADIMVQRDYTSIIYKLLGEFESCHIGRHVLYLDHNGTDNVLKDHHINDGLKCDRIVGYFEGGSLGCRKDAFARIGGFCEQFIGYGCEDCEFFERLNQSTTMFDGRSVDFIHLKHGRSNGWERAHQKNRIVHRKLGKMPMNVRINNIYVAFKEKYGI